jgi:N-acyl-D-aspartate/D-glutamate deacylase
MAKGQQSAVNRAFMVPLSPLRTYVMGSDAGTRGATADETTQMAKHIEAAMAAGASGFSTSNNRSQIGYQASRSPRGSRAATSTRRIAAC